MRTYNITKHSKGHNKSESQVWFHYYFVTIWHKLFWRIILTLCSGFKRMGLWEVCFAGMVLETDPTQKAYHGCWWILAPEFRQIKGWLMPSNDYSQLHIKIWTVFVLVKAYLENSLNWVHCIPSFYHSPTHCCTNFKIKLTLL